MTQASSWGPVSATALGVAAVRAAETRRSDRLFEDPYAEPLLAAAAAAGAVQSRAAPESQPPSSAQPVGDADPVGRALRLHVSIRTRFLDDQLRQVCAAGCRQVVLLGAGLDTRAYRLPWPDGVRMFALDLPDVVTVVASAMTDIGARPRCELVHCAVDLTRPWADTVVEAGLDAQRPVAWIAEGVLVYLTKTDATGVLDQLTRLSAAGSTFVTERGGPHDATRPEHPVTSLWQGGLQGQVADMLTQRGWTTVLHRMDSLARQYGRPMSGPSRSGYVVATRS